MQRGEITPIVPPIYGAEVERIPTAHYADGRSRQTRTVEELEVMAYAPSNGIYDNREDEPFELGGFSRRNGGKHYVDGFEACGDDDGLTPLSPAYETATPETTSVSSMRTYVHANDQLAIEAMRHFMATRGDIKAMSYQYRASHGTGNAYGLQLNYGLPTHTISDMGYLNREVGLRHFAHSILAASYITGAGAIEPNGTYMSQKMQGLGGLEGRRDYGTVYGLPSEMGDYSTLHRIEQRLADLHPKEWGGFMQAGIGGIALTVAQLAPNVPEGFFPRLYAESEMLRRAKRDNMLTIFGDGTIRMAPEALKGIDWVLRVCNVFLDMELPDTPAVRDLQKAAAAAIDFSVTFARVRRAEGTIYELRQATWADRFAHNLEVLTQTDGPVDFTQPDRRAIDTEYDKVVITPEEVRHGSGFDRGKPTEYWHVPDATVQHAMQEPPSDTRAYARAHVLRAESDPTGIAMNWSQIQVTPRQGRLREIHMPEPLSPKRVIVQ